MNHVYLVVENGREDSYTFVGQEADIKRLLAKDKEVLLSYPGSNKDVWLNFKFTDDPESFVKPQASKNKHKSIIGTILFICVPLLAIYGLINLIKVFVGS